MTELEKSLQLPCLCAAQPPRTIAEGNGIGKNGNYSGKTTDLSAKGTTD